MTQTDTVTAERERAVDAVFAEPEPANIAHRSQQQQEPPREHQRPMEQQKEPVPVPPMQALHSEQIGELAIALAAAQSEFTAIERRFTAKVKSKKGEDSSYTYKYADLDTVLQAVRPALSNHQLALMQFPTTRKDALTVMTMLVHGPSQQWVRNHLTVGCFGTDPQEIGSAETYARRYGLCALIGVAATQGGDDDGERASRGARRAEEPPAPAPRRSQQQAQQAPAPSQTPARQSDNIVHVGTIRSTRMHGTAFMVEMTSRTSKDGFVCATRDATLRQLLEKHAKDGDTVEVEATPGRVDPNDPSKRYAPSVVRVSAQRG